MLNKILKHKEDIDNKSFFFWVNVDHHLQWPINAGKFYKALIYTCIRYAIFVKKKKLMYEKEIIFNVGKWK